MHFENGNWYITERKIKADLNRIISTEHQRHIGVFNVNTTQKGHLDYIFCILFVKCKYIYIMYYMRDYTSTGLLINIESYLISKGILLLLFISLCLSYKMESLPFV